MRDSPEAEAFFARLDALPHTPGIPLDTVLQPSLDDEASLRRLFAQDKTNERLKDPYVGLIDVFNAPPTIKVARARVVKDEQDLSDHYIMPLSDKDRRKEGEPCMVGDIEDFRKNWAIFTEGSLAQLLDWNNVVAAGGSVLACLAPLSDSVKASKRALRKKYHSVAFPTSDIDLFLWGLNAEEAERKMVKIYEAVRDSVPWDVTCIRTKNTVSIHSQYPYRSVQIVLRLYSSPAEILAGFDVDAPCCAYDGNAVWANPRAIVAMIRQCNTVDVTRRSPSYEIRLAKYAARGFEVYVPTLKRTCINPTIYERSISSMQGLARLLVLEKLVDEDVRNKFLDSRRNLRDRLENKYQLAMAMHKRKKRLKGDLKANSFIIGLEMNNYDVACLHIPYGPGWDARRIQNLIYQTDLGMNSTFNPKNKGRRLHRHPAFFGDVDECIADCCEYCPLPSGSVEKKLQDEEDKTYVRGRLSFVEEDPGRQSVTGSFNPIDVGEWSEQAYIKSTEKLFSAIASKNLHVVQKTLEESEIVNTRDHVGRTPLHFAIISGAPEIACALIDAGARMIARLVGGKTALHLAAEYDQLGTVRKLLERSRANSDSDNSKRDDPSSYDEDSQMKNADDEDNEGGDDEDEEEEDDEGSPKKKKSQSKGETQNSTDILQDDNTEPDIVDINMDEWDMNFSPLCFAILFASIPVIEELISAGADVKNPRKGTTPTASILPLTLTLLRENEDEACLVAERLVMAGATCSMVDDKMFSVFHAAVTLGKVKIVSTLLKCDPQGPTMLDFPWLPYNRVIFPVVTAIAARDYAMLATLLAHGVKLDLSAEDVARAYDASPPGKRQGLFLYIPGNAIDYALKPVETAIQAFDDVIHLLNAMEAPVNTGLTISLTITNPSLRRTIFDWTRTAVTYLKKLNEREQEQQKFNDSAPIPQHIQLEGWKNHMNSLEQDIQNIRNSSLAQYQASKEEENRRKRNVKQAYLQEVERLLIARGAKTWQAVYPSVLTKAGDFPVPALKIQGDIVALIPYTYLANSSYMGTPVPEHLHVYYDELYEACFAGDDRKIREMCLPPKNTNTQKRIALLNISVEASCLKSNIYVQTGYTPLYAAISGRQWKTSKLILAIAMSQYQPEDAEEKCNINILVDDDDDNGSENSCETASMKVDEEEKKYIDIAKSLVDVHSSISPFTLLDKIKFSWRSSIPAPKNSVIDSGNLLNKATNDDDLEAFINIADLYNMLPESAELSKDHLRRIVERDSPEICDEFIRRTGYGIDIPNGAVKYQETAVVDEQNQLYLGLNIKGKKRMDLASAGDPNAITSDNKPDPLLWQAIAAGAKGIIKYLASDRIISAYRFYASTHNTPRALLLQHSSNIENVPKWLGWTVDDLGKSPLTSGIMGNKLDIIKLLFDLSPTLMQSCLQKSVKFVGYNPVLLAIQFRCDVEVMDFLLSLGVSPTERDKEKNWNIFHALCAIDDEARLQYFLEKLPRETNETLLKQQSKDKLDTPLHIAVNVGSLFTVQRLLEYGAIHCMKNAFASTPLHIAVQKGHAEIVSILLQASPDSLYLENGVGNTVLEIAAQKRFTDRLMLYRNDITNRANKPIGELNGNAFYVDDNSYNTIDDSLRHSAVLSSLRCTIDSLLLVGKLDIKSKLAWELNTFAAMMESRLAVMKKDEELRLAANTDDDKVEKKNGNWKDSKKTLELVRDAVAGVDGHRQLISVFEVQQSMSASLLASKKPEENKDEDVDDFNGKSLNKHVMTMTLPNMATFYPS